MWVVLIIIQYTRYPIIVQKIPLHEEMENMSDYLLRHSILRCVRWKTDDIIKISHRYTHLKRENILCVLCLYLMLWSKWVGFLYIFYQHASVGRIRHLLLPIYFAYFLGFYKIFSLHSHVCRRFFFYVQLYFVCEAGMKQKTRVTGGVVKPSYSVFCMSHRDSSSLPL